MNLCCFTDLMLDRRTGGSADRLAPDAPVIVFRAEGGVEDDFRLGGGAVAPWLVAGWGEAVSVAGTVGDDANGREVQRLLNEARVATDLLLVDPARPTTCKHRFFGRAAGGAAQQLMRLDTESREPICESLETKLLDGLLTRIGECSVVLISDYGKGVCTPRLVQAVIAAARKRNIPVLIDPARGDDGSKYTGATLLKPNRQQASDLTGIPIRSIDDAVEAGHELRHRFQLDACVVTLDEEGLVLVDDEHAAGLHFAPTRRKPVDVTGAGDTVLAVLGYGVTQGWDRAEACRVANLAAGLQVQRPGVARITKAELDALIQPPPVVSPRLASQAKIVSLETLVSHITRLRLTSSEADEPPTMVFTNGCFDLLHAGHLSTLQFADWYA